MKVVVCFFLVLAAIVAAEACYGDKECQADECCARKLSFLKECYPKPKKGEKCFRFLGCPCAPGFKCSLAEHVCVPDGTGRVTTEKPDTEMPPTEQE